MVTSVIQGLGQAGFQPDVAPTNLPTNAFTHARNWLFNEANYAEVTQGYTNALSSRNLTVLGDENTEATFLYTWLLSNQNALAYYDGGNNQMKYIENNPTQDLVEYNMSVRDAWSKDLVYSSDTTLTNGQFHITANSVIISDVDSTAILAAGDTTFARIELFDNRQLIADVQLASIATAVGQRVTVAGLDGLPQYFSDGETYSIRISTPVVHDTLADHTWNATDAFGVPIFTNRFEAPWVFVDEPIPNIATLTHWPTGAIARNVVKFNAFLIAIGYENETAAAGSQGNRRTLAISDVITVPGSLPLWDFSNADSFSQLFDLSLYSDGDIVSAYEANNLLYVNTTTDVVTLSYIGNGEFQATKLPYGTGVITDDASVPVPNGFFNIGNGRMYTHDGSSYTPVGEGVWVDSWFTTVFEDRLDEVQLIYDTRNKSVWIKTPVSETQQEIWILNLDSGAMSVLDDHQEVKYMLMSAEGLPAINTTWDTFPGNAEWDTLQFDSWNDFPSLLLGEFRNRILSVGGREVFVHDYGTTYNGRAITAILQKEFFRTSDSTYDSFSIDRVILWADGQEGDQIDVRIGGSDSTHIQPTYTPYLPYRLGTTRKLDFRKRVKWGAFTIRTATGGIRLSGLEINTTPRARR